jgi:O-antigen ligase
METLPVVDSVFPGSPRAALNERLPWAMVLVSFLLTLIACQQLNITGTPSEGGDVLRTLLLVGCAAIGFLLFPGRTLQTYLCSYLALRVLSVSSLVGYSTTSYIALTIAVLLIYRLNRAHKSPIELPGTPWLLCFAVLVCLQFFRSASMRDSFPVLSDEVVFTLVLWRFAQISKAEIRKAANALIVGTCAGGVAFLLVSKMDTYRLGWDLGFNPNELGNVIGAVLLLLVSGFFLRRQYFAYWGIVGSLAILLLLTGSRSSIYACFLGIILFLFLRKMRRTAVTVAFVAIAIVAMGYSSQLDYDPSSMTGRLASPISLSFDESSAQRATIWAFLLTQVGAHWKWGAGLGNVSVVAEAAGAPVIENNVFVGFQSHNLYLTVLLELGILGLLLLLGWQLKTLYWAFTRPLENALLIAMMLYLTILGFFEGSNLNFLSAFLLIAAYRVQSEPRIQDNEVPKSIPVVAASRF